jgi:hypothetical protein
MMTRNERALFIVVLATMTAASLGGWTAVGGELEPPVPIGTPTMKPLNEVEPRRPIYASMMPLTITDSGSSWYLAENIVTTGEGIEVAAGSVTIDLMGFRLSGDPGHGPGIDGPIATEVVVKNGSIVGWDKGIVLSYRSVVSNVRVSYASFSCIEVDSQSLVMDSEAVYCGHHGIVVDSNSVVRGCIASNNMQNGIWSSWVDQGGFTNQGRLISGNVVTGNYRNGLRVDGHASVTRNHITANNIGIDLDGHENIIIKSTLVHNITAAYDIDP